MTPPPPAIELEELFRPAQAGQDNQTRDDTQEDPGKDMWATYMNEVKEDDIRDAAAWRQDADGILVFTGLFAATVGAFIIEFYKKLSPDSGGQTVDLLKQISRQLAGSSNGTDTNTENQSPSSETLIVWVMAMWLMSLVLSITSALVATLLQQWARRYTEMPKMPSKAFHRARVRSFMFYGTQLYKMRVAVQMPSALLHLSVFFFFGGLVALFHSVNKKVAIAVYVSVGLFAVAYITLTILPCLDHRCPYRTPMSYILWYPWHSFLSLVALCGRFFIGQVDDLMAATPTSDDGSSSTLSWLVQYFEEDVKKRKQRLKDGFVKSIIHKAIQAPIDLDRMALTWLFKILALADKSKLSKFVASIPRDKVIELVTPPFDSGKLVFREPFLKLLQSCAEGPRAVETISANIQSQPQTPEFKTPPTGMYAPAVLFFKENGDLDEEAIKSHVLRLAQVLKLEEDVLKRCRLSYLHVIHHIAEAFIVTGFDEAWTLTLLDDVRANFAKISFMREMWSDDDIVIRITSRSICALLAKRLLQKSGHGEAELRWLYEVTGEQANAILNSPDIAVVGENTKVFVSRVLEHDLPNEHVSFFAKTLAILFDAGVHIPFDRTKFRNSLSALIRSVEAEVANKLRQIFHDILEPPTPPASSPAAPTPSASALSAPALPTPGPSPMPTPTFPQAPARAPASPTPTPVQP